ncbi:MAG: response regulator transcription factor [Magnetococcales bacterium]|nr:response regulator transcription factor [Magnetococcales bacterium]
MVTILIVEDEPDLLSTLEYNLQRAGFHTQACLTGEEGLNWIADHGPPGLVLLDIMLPGISGIEVCYRLRAQEQTRATPVIFLSARAEEIDRVIGFELGADDYVVKPFNIRELILRIRAVLRRNGEETVTSIKTEESIGPLRLNRKRHQVWLNEVEVVLTPVEFRLLSLLLARKGVVQSREVLLTDVWHVNSLIQLRTVDAHIKRLREKLGAAGDMLETIRGVGYRIQAAC